MVWGEGRSCQAYMRECSKLTVNGEAELAEASIERIEGRFDRLDHSRVEIRRCIILGVRRRCIQRRKQSMFAGDAEVAATQKARVHWLNGGLDIPRITANIAHDFASSVAARGLLHLDGGNSLLGGTPTTQEVETTSGLRHDGYS